MNIYSLPEIISFTINFSVALIIILSNPKSALNRWFSIFVSIFFLWNLSEILILNSANFQNANFWAFILYRIIFLIPAFYVIIAYYYPINIHSYSHNPLFYILVFGLPVIFLMLTFPDFTIQLVHLQKERNIYYYLLDFNIKDIKFLILLLIAISYLIWGTVIFLTKIKSVTIKQKTQIKFLLLGFLMIFSLFILVNIFRTLIVNTKSYYFLSTLISLVISLFFLSAIFRYNIFSSPKFQKKGILLSFIMTLILGIYFLTIIVLSDIIISLFKLDSVLIEIILIVVLIFLIKPLHSRVQDSINKFINRNINQYRDNFAELTLSLQYYQNKLEFAKKIQSFLIENFNLIDVIILLKQNNIFQIVNNREISLSINTNQNFIMELSKFGNIVELPEINKDVIDKQLLDILKVNKIAIILKLIYQEQLNGILFLSQKRFGKKFSHEDLVALSIFINEVSLAYQRNQMIENIQAEAKEKYKIEKLAAIGQMTSGVAHEIRNPLNTISIAAQTLKKKKLDSENQKELLDYITEEINRLERILKDFLKLSKTKSANISSVNIEDLIDKLVLTFDFKNEINCSIKKNIDVENKIIQTDADMLFQILSNLLLNSYDAIKIRCNEDEEFNCSEGTIELDVYNDKQSVIIKVSDNGIGINSNDKISIFNPFFTTKEDGTGLGLSIVYNLVESLNGKIDFVSERNNTIFYIKLNID